MDTADRSAGMRCARWSAVLIILAVGAAAFRLSFATLKDLAVLAHVPAQDAWLFPLIVDGTIVLATVGVLVCPGRDRRFFLWVLVVGAVVSVAGNSLHAVAAGQPLPAWAAALVAAIAPASLLADTHGLAVLFRAAHRNPVPDPAAVNDPTQLQASTAPEAVELPDPDPITSAPAPDPVAALSTAPPVSTSSVRSTPSAPQQQTMLPIAVPVGG